MKTLDPRDPVSKKQIKGTIADAIVKDVAGSSRSDVVQRIETEYERLLAGAAIFTHVPSLTAGLVTHAERQLIRRQRAVANVGAAERVLA